MNKFLDLIQSLVKDQTNADSAGLVDYLINGISDFIFLMEVTDSSYRYGLINEAAKEFLKIGESWNGKVLEDVFSSSEYLTLKKSYDMVLHGKKPLSFEDESEIGGQAFHGHSILTPIINEEGECTHVLCVTRNITDRVMKERELERTNEMLVSLMNNTADAVMVLSPGGEVVEVNPALEEMYGWKFEDLQGREIPFVPDHLKKESQSLIARVLHGEVISSYETKRMKKDGVLLDVSISLSPLHNAKGNVVAVSTITRDISEQKRVEKRLEENESKYASLFRYSPDPIFHLDLNGTIVNVNPACERLLGYDRKTLKNSSFLEFVPSGDFEHALIELKQASSGFSTSFESKIQCADELIKLFDVTTSPIIWNQKLYGIYGILQDKTEKVQALQALQSSEEKYRLIADRSHDLITVHEPDGKITYVSPSHEHLLGVKVDEMSGESLTFTVHQEDHKKLKQSFYQSLLTMTPFTVRVRQKNFQGEWLWYEAKGAPVDDQHGKVSHVVIVSRDITDRISYEERLKEIAFYDHLTDLPNRRLFEDRLKQVFVQSARHNKPFAVMYLDGDGFKAVNDELGHHIGDEYLRSVGRRLMAWVREEDTVARIGGDEFAVILTNVESREDVIMIAERLRDSLHQPYDIEDQHFQSSFSIGLSIYPEDGEDVATLIQRADQALYQAKEEGKNQVFWIGEVLLS